MTRERMPVVVRGKVYPNAAVAAKALKVAESSVFCAIMRGNVDRLGLGIDYKKRVTKGGKCREITIAGKKFESMAALAKAIGRPAKSVRFSLNAGPAARANIARAVMKLIADQENAAMRAVMLSADLQPHYNPKR